MQQQALPTTMNKDQEPTFLTLFPANYGVQIATVLACQERFGFFPTHLLVHPERYEWCEYKELYIPYPQEGVQSSLALLQMLASKEEESPLPPLELPTFPVLRVGICADPTLKWYMIRCLSNPT